MQSTNIQTAIRRGGATLALGTCAVLFGALLALAAPGGASAHATIPFHAKLGHADPAIGAVLKTAPTKVMLTFVENATPNGSNIVVYGDKGEQVSTGPATINSSDATKMTVNMTGDDSETYVVVFHTVSADDGHAYTDAYQFTVSSSATASAGQQPDIAGDSISSVVHAPSPSSSGVQPLIAALIGIVGLVIGAAGGFFVARSQRVA